MSAVKPPIHNQKSSSCWRLALAAIGLFLFSVPALAVAPVATIVVMGNTASRMAPHVLHVDATASTAGTGTLATCTFTWTFTGAGIAGGTMSYADPRPGKSAIRYDGFVDERGFNAACICRSAGNVHTVLVVTNELGETGTTSTDTTIVADARTHVYCDPGLASGANDGSSPANAFQAWEGAGGAQLYMFNSGAAATHLSFNRGKTIPNSAANLVNGSSATNVWIDAYGTGANPLVLDSQTSGSNTAWDVRRDSENIIIEKIDFQGDSSRVVNALRFRTDTLLRNVAILDCNFSSVAQATNTTENPNICQGFLQMNCTVSNHDQYGFYGEYDDAVFLGCTSTNVTQQNESSIRFSGFRISWDCTYSKFIHPTSNKDAFRVMTRDPTHGCEYLWVARSSFIGPVEICWNSDVGNPATGKFQVVEDSLLVPNDSAAGNTWMSLGGNGGSSYADVTIRNNIFYYTGTGNNVNPPIASGVQQASTRCVIIDNTLVIRGNAGLADLLSINVNSDNTRIERNLLISSSDGKAYFFKTGAAITANSNVWYTTGAVANVNGEGNLSLANWNARTGTGDDFAQTSPQITYSDITAPGFRPADTFLTIYGEYPAPAGARLTDYNGGIRGHPVGAAGAVDAAIISSPSSGSNRVTIGIGIGL